jgi:Flp pilus assembly protein TadG
MFWRRKKKQVEQAVDEVALAANDLVQKTMVIGPSGVLLLLGAAAVGVAATYYVTQKKKAKKAGDDTNKKAAP